MSFSFDRRLEQLARLDESSFRSHRALCDLRVLFWSYTKLFQGERCAKPLLARPNPWKENDQYNHMLLLLLLSLCFVLALINR